MSRKMATAGEAKDHVRVGFDFGDSVPVEAEQIDRETALRLNQEGGTLVCLDVPAKAEFGVDTMSWVVKDKFQGFKMIPPGVHFFHFRFTCFVIQTCVAMHLPLSADQIVTL